MAEAPKSSGPKKLEALDDEDLADLRQELNDEKIAIKARENEVQAEIDLRAALASMSSETRRVVKIRLEGGIAPTGETKT